MDVYRRQSQTSMGQNRNVCNELTPQDTFCVKENIECYPLAMAYVPWQQWNQVYSPDKALVRGTIFPDLDLPFCGMRGGKR